MRRVSFRKLTYRNVRVSYTCMTASKNKSSSFFLQIYIKPKIIYCTKYLICLPINILCPIFGIHNSLAAVKPVITGEHITEGNGKKEIRHTVIAK